MDNLQPKLSLKFYHTQNTLLPYFVKQECCKLACAGCIEPVFLSYGLPETSCMTGCGCGKIIKASFKDLNSIIDEYHTGVAKFQCSEYHC